MSGANSGSVLDRVPIIQSVVAGLAAYVASFVVVAILVAGTEDGDDLVGFSGNILYSSHFAKSDIEVSTAMGSQTRTRNLLSEGATELSEVVYYAVPIVVLVVVGIALARVVRAQEPDAAAIAGALTAVGYVLMTILGTFLFEFNQSGGMFGGDTTITPALTAMTIVVMGIVYPAVFGAIGGAIGSRL